MVIAGSARTEVIGTGLFRDSFDRENGFQSEILTNYGKWNQSVNIKVLVGVEKQWGCINTGHRDTNAKKNMMEAWTELAQKCYNQFKDTTRLTHWSNFVTAEWECCRSRAKLSWAIVSLFNGHLLSVSDLRQNLWDALTDTSSYRLEVKNLTGTSTTHGTVYLLCYDLSTWYAHHLFGKFDLWFVLGL